MLPGGCDFRQILPLKYGLVALSQRIQGLLQALPVLAAHQGGGPSLPGPSRKQDRTGSEQRFKASLSFPRESLLAGMLPSQRGLIPGQPSKRSSLLASTDFCLTGQRGSSLWAWDPVYLLDKEACLVFQQMKTNI